MNGFLLNVIGTAWLMEPCTSVSTPIINNAIMLVCELLSWKYTSDTWFRVVKFYVVIYFQKRIYVTVIFVACESCMWALGVLKFSV